MDYRAQNRGLRGLESAAAKMGGLASYPIDIEAVIAELGIRPSP
ncbi:MAG: hypothetical protein ACLP50_03355 [Solirubrobacteraceae bacterium]